LENSKISSECLQQSFVILSIRNSCFCITGYVALIVGSSDQGPAVEVYSPDGMCQHRLADIPVGGAYLHLPTLAYIDGKLLSCAGDAVGNSTASVYLVTLFNKPILIKRQTNK
jgi:hypothetical protein